MILENEMCRIEVKIDESYTVDSTDNRHYDVILNPCHYRHNDFSKTFSIYIDLFTSTFQIALIGSYYAHVSDCAILDDNILTILQNKTITQININNGSILHHIKLDCFGCNFAIYKVEQGYIIYGEIEITMLDFSFTKKWSFSGKDIFVSVSDTNPFALHEKSICLYDFEGNFYEIDFEGNIISFQRTE